MKMHTEISHETASIAITFFNFGGLNPMYSLIMLDLRITCKPLSLNRKLKISDPIHIR